jgi:hypothetical protein
MTTFEAYLPDQTMAEDLRTAEETIDFIEKELANTAIIIEDKDREIARLCQRLEGRKEIFSGKKASYGPIGMSFFSSFFVSYIYLFSYLDYQEASL